MKSYKVTHHGKSVKVKATDTASAVVAARKVMDYNRVKVGCIEIAVNDELKAYSVGSVTHINSPWDENNFRQYAKQCIDAANKIKELESKGYKENVIDAYKR